MSAGSGVDTERPGSSPAPAAVQSPERDAFEPSHRLLERLLLAFDASLRIDRRIQLFLWSQGVLQSFIPHQTLICACGNFASGSIAIDTYSSDGVPTEQRPAADPSEPAHALVHLLHDAWLETGRRPVAIAAESLRDSAERPLTQAVWELGLGNLLAHGACSASGADDSFFVFGRMPAAPLGREQQLIALLLPYLHLAVQRCLADERAVGDGGRRDAGPVLSNRERQIMRHVRDGKTNAQIGVALNLSPLTVKNHVQRVLRKLGASNRAQAIAWCVERKLVDDSRVAERRFTPL